VAQCTSHERLHPLGSRFAPAKLTTPCLKRMPTQEPLTIAFRPKLPNALFSLAFSPVIGYNCADSGAGGPALPVSFNSKAS
jgi:hypothetical protein